MITKEQIKEQLKDPEWVSPAGKETGTTRCVWDPVWGMRILAVRDPFAEGWIANAIHPGYSTEICTGKTFPEMEEEVKEWVADEIYHTLKQSKNG
jgi:hypothetical protein|nr:MAG TPA: hypothetical protein [Crassvirales sp.]